MAKQNLTVFQKLGMILGPDGFKTKPEQQQKQTQQIPKYKVGKEVLLQTQSKQEYETAKLQAQQNKYLGSMWRKVEHGLFQQAVNYETTRIGSYSDFEAMEFYPEIAAALDIMMEESTTLNSNGRMINVYSDSKRVKTIIEDLLFNRLDIHTSLPMWTRNTPIRENSIIPLLDGTDITIKELSNRVKSGEEVWTYSIQDGTKAIVPSKVTWCDLTRKNSELYRVTLDDGSHIDTTPDHEYMLRDGTLKRADELTEGQSLMPFYTRISDKKQDKIAGYEKVYNPATGKYKFTHTMVAHECVRNLDYEKSMACQFDTHHADFNKRNNHPDNLKRLTHSDHFRLHVEHFDKILGSPEVVKKRMDGIDRYLRSDARKERLSKEMSGIYPKYKEKSLLNHKVISVVKLNETSDVYCLEAVGPNGEHDRHNFPVLGKNLNGSYSRYSGIFLSNCKYGDNFVYLNIDDKNGITGAKQMPNYEMERRDGGLFDMLTQRTDEDYQTDKVKFYWRGRDVEFNSWQIAHFRLLGDDRRLPYGTSMLEKARRIWKQLILSEDAMLVYRVTRAPERRIYKIYVGNIDDKDVEAYVNEIANRFKRTPVIDPQTGQIDLRYNQLSNDQDYFIPVRSEDAPNPIDTLPGAANLDQIADIEYLQKKLFTALRVPKPFLGFDETTGEGKNLALQDIRFSRTINRIQQAMLQELNKIVIIHLYLLGFEDDLDNFTLTLNNPSTQAEMLKVEHLQLKITLFKDATSDIGNGFAPMSMTRAKREILGWSDNEIKQDFIEQRMEKAAAAELQNTANVIKHTGIFDTVDRIYGDYQLALKGGGTPPQEGEGEPAGGGPTGGGGFGGGGVTPEDLDFGAGEAGAEVGDAGAEVGDAGAEAGDAGAEADTEAKAEPTAESIKKMGNLLLEQKRILNEKLQSRTNKYQNRFIHKLISMVDQEPKSNENVKIYDKNVKINESINNMIRDIDDMLEK